LFFFDFDQIVLMNPQTGNNTHLTMFQSASWDQEIAEMASEWTTTNVVRKRNSKTTPSQNDRHHRELTVHTEDLPFVICTQPSPKTKHSLVKSITDGWIDCQTRRLGVGRVSEIPNQDLLTNNINPSISSSSSTESSDTSSSSSKGNGLIGIRPSIGIHDEDGWFVFAINKEQSSPPPPIQILKFTSQDIKESDDDMSDVSLCIDDEY
jgi:hypothetical protein